MSSDTFPPLPSAPPLALAGERVAFTGTLASMTHEEAQRLVEQHGGSATEHVSRQSTLLVVGEEGGPLEADGQPSVKLLHAARLIQEGVTLRVVPESDWLQFIGLEGDHGEAHRLYTPAMLSGLLDLPVGCIRSWERAGLIHAAHRVHRLPYFDYQEVASARRLAQLLAAGVSRRQIELSLERVRTLLPGIERPLAQLEILAGGERLAYRDAEGRLKSATGQRLFDFNPTESDGTDADSSLRPFFPAVSSPLHDWLAEGRRLLDLGDVAEAVSALRQGVARSPLSTEMHFSLAEALYRMNNPQAALERYGVAVELDPSFIEAWTQLGCLAAELGDVERAEGAFRAALSAHPDCPDAHYHLSELLEQRGHCPEAAVHLRRYLEFDRRGPWAILARERLMRFESIP